MKTRYVLVLSYHDRSAILQTFGPYDLPEQAERAGQELRDLPFMQEGAWDVLPCLDWPTPEES